MYFNVTIIVYPSTTILQQGTRQRTTLYDQSTIVVLVYIDVHMK